MKKKAIVSVALCLALVFTAAMSVFAADRTAEDIAADAAFIPVTLDDGRETVYIRVGVESEPAIRNLSVCIKTGKLLYERQQAEYGDAGLALMSERHIVGELAMHVILYALFSGVGGADENSPVHDYYARAAVADLNIDEARIPGVEAVGSLILALDSMFGLAK